MPALNKKDLDLILNKLNQNIENFPCFVETGTFYGDTISQINNFFNEVYTIEFKEDLYNSSKGRFQNYKHINFILGDSSKELPKLLENIKKNIIFWLDGHYSMGVTGLSEKSCPLIEECMGIDDKFIGTKSIVVIDDSRQFGNVYHDGEIDWSEVTELSILECFKKHKVVQYFYIDSEICENDRMIILIEKL